MNMRGKTQKIHIKGQKIEAAGPCDEKGWGRVRVETMSVRDALTRGGLDAVVEWALLVFRLGQGEVGVRVGAVVSIKGAAGIYEKVGKRRGNRIYKKHHEMRQNNLELEGKKMERRQRNPKEGMTGSRDNMGKSIGRHRAPAKGKHDGGCFATALADPHSGVAR